MPFSIVPVWNDTAFLLETLYSLIYNGHQFLSAGEFIKYNLHFVVGSQDLPENTISEPLLHMTFRQNKMHLIFESILPHGCII